MTGLRSRPVGSPRGFFVHVLLLTSPLYAPSAADAQSVRDASPAWTAVGAILGGGVGFAGGGLLGCGGLDCDEPYTAALIGAATGEVLGLAFGGHLGNRRRGNFIAALGVGLGAGAVGLGALSLIGLDQVALLGAAVAQVIGVVIVEVRTSPTVTVTPRPDPARNRMGLGVTLRW